MERSAIRATKRRIAPQALRIPSAAAVRAGDDFEEVTVGVLEVDTASAVVVIDLARLLPPGIGPAGKISIPNPAENLVEFGFADQKGVMLRRDFAVSVHVIEIGSVLGDDDLKWPPALRAARFSISARNVAEALLSCADTIVWLKWIAMSLLPGGVFTPSL